MFRLASAALATAWLVGAPVVADEPPLRFTDGPRTLEALPASLYQPAFLTDGDASETWDYAFYFEETRHLLLAQFMVTNLGPGDHRGAALGWILPADGEPGIVRNSRKRSEWSLDVTADAMRMGVGNHVLQIEHPRHVVQVNHGKRGTFQLEATASTPPFRLGRIDYGRGEFLDLALLAPRLRAHGMVQMPGQPAVTLRDGVGVALYRGTTVAERDRMVGALRFDSFQGDRQVSLFELTASKSRAHQRLAALLVLQGASIEYHATGFERQFIDVAREAEQPGYPLPGGFAFRHVAGDRRVVGQADLELLRRDDVLSFVNGGLTRFFARMSLRSRPVGYRFRADYDLDLRLGDEASRAAGVGLATLTLVNAPPPGW